MEQFLSVLQSCVLFENIRPEEIRGMLACFDAPLKMAGKNAAILSEGDSAEFVGVLLSGSANVVKEDYYGNRSIVGRVEAGELFAESFACAGVKTMPVSVIANEPCHYLLIHCQRITVGCANACSFHSQVIFNLLKAVAGRNLEFHQKLEVTAKRTTREKLMAYLLNQAKLHGSSSFTIPFDRQALADYLGVERSAMSAELSKLRDDGVLETNRSRFTLL
jgi:CRP-like cAMP-binding protein